jgi:hypothetical protein
VAVVVDGVQLYGWSDGTSYSSQGEWQSTALACEIHDLDPCYGHADHSYSPCLGDKGGAHSPYTDPTMLLLVPALVPPLLAWLIVIALSGWRWEH